MTELRDVLVPVALLKDPAGFGGTRENDCLRGDLIIGKTHALGLRPAAPSDTPRMVIPALTEAHCHLDKCHSITRMGAVGGDLTTAAAAQAADKIHWTEEDLRKRMARGLEELVASGCNVARSHIDWSDTPEPPLSWHVLKALASEPSAVEVEAAALTDITQMADTQFCAQVAGQIAAQPNSVLGSFILFHDPKHIRDGLKNMFSAAEKYGLALDFHVDEALGDWNGLEAICDTAIETGFEGPILCGHTVSLMDRSPADFARIADKLLRARVHICALPTTNLYLQGRTSGTPDRRGLTRLRELHEAGVPIVVASDNVGDAFCPTGQHDPRAALHLAGLAAHLDPPMGHWLPAITTQARTALGRDPGYIETVGLADLRITDAASTAELVAGRSSLTPLTLERSPQ